jgi:hypothetical protein
MQVFTEIPFKSTQKPADRLREAAVHLSIAHWQLRKVAADPCSSFGEGLINRVATDTLISLFLVEGMARISTLHVEPGQAPTEDALQAFPAEVGVQ